VICCSDQDLVDVPKRARDELKIVPVEHMDQVLKIALSPSQTERNKAVRQASQSPAKAESETNKGKNQQTGRAAPMA
jgi:ATP-dependent Lon protease